MLNGMRAFEKPGRWFKGNLHTHTTVSDGPLSPEDTIARYRSIGHHFIAITDHRKGARAFARHDSDFLVLPGTELHPSVPWSSRSYHIVIPEVPTAFPVERMSNSLVETLHEITGRHIPFFIGHPYWCGHDVLELLPLAQFALGLEVFNATCTRIGRGFSPWHWDDLLARGFALSAIAVDDVHMENEFAIGWTMVRAPSLRRASIMTALTEGDFYASTGPVIEDFTFKKGVVSLRTSPVETICLIAPDAQGCSVSATPGETVTELSWELPKGFGAYLRGECWVGRQAAWTNPVFFKDGLPRP
ncbi:MAG: hypothetical protein V2A58_11120 [Planctomycetota bacterium]